MEKVTQLQTLIVKKMCAVRMKGVGNECRKNVLSATKQGRAKQSETIRHKDI